MFCIRGGRNPTWSGATAAVSCGSALQCGRLISVSPVIVARAWWWCSPNVLGITIVFEDVCCWISSDGESLLEKINKRINKKCQTKSNKSVRRICKRPPLSDGGLFVCGGKTQLFSPRLFIWPSSFFFFFFCWGEKQGGLVRAACDLLIHLHKLVRAAL